MLRLWRISPLAAIAFTAAISCACNSAEDGADAASRAAPMAHPEARGYTQLVYHRPSGQIILYGGEGNGRVSLQDTWAYDLRTDAWNQLDTDLHPVEAGGATAAYDIESDRIIVHFTTRLDPSATSGLARISETWALDVAAGRWTNMRPDPAPFGLMGARMVYDAAADRMILFGGADFSQEAAPRFDETWAYDFNTNTWTKREPERRPPGRSYFGVAYDAQAEKTLIFGGSFAEDAKIRADELWAYDYPSDTWEELTYTGDVRSDHHPFMVYAAGPNRTLYLVNEAFWAFDYPSRAWTELAYDTALGVRHFHAMAFDDEAQRLVLFGGGPRGLRYDNQTWVYDPAVNRWERKGQ